MALTIQNLSKTYANGVKALNNINLTIENGMFGLLGPNGAGKSSLMRTIATLQEPDSGSITFNDIDVITQKDEVRKVLGYLPQDFGVYPKISAETLLDHLAVLKGITNKKLRKETVEYLLEKTNLQQHRKKNLGGYSGGMKQRFGIAQALLGNPELLIVDEPTAGLDPAERNRFYNLLSELSTSRVVILSTHIVEDVKELCKQMAIINRGQVVLQGNPMDAVNDLQGMIYEAKIEKRGDVEEEFLRNGYHVISEKRIMGDPVFHIYSKEALARFKAIEPDLEDVYFKCIVPSQAS
jgi:ABC-2 type transport system ATP-binding protein